MITITIPHTQLEQDLEAIDKPLQRIESRTRANAADLNQSLNTFWSLPEDRLLAVLNHYGPAVVNEIFTAHARNAEAMNALLADRGIEPIAKIGSVRELTLVDGVFGLVPLPEPEIVDLPIDDPIIE